MPAKVWMLRSLHDTLSQAGIDPEILRKKFAEWKAGDEFEHFWFCHEVHPDRGDDLYHVHMLPTLQEAFEKWNTYYHTRGKRKLRRSDRYVLYAHSRHHGYLIIDVLDDPGAHDLWKQRRTTLKGYEAQAWSFAADGTKKLDAC